MEKLSRRDFVKHISYGIGSVATATLLGTCNNQFAGVVTAAKRPNILFILTDNQRWDTMGCAGNPIIYTPNMNYLAANGKRFANAFVTTAICAASRASILTGLYLRKHQSDFMTPPLQSQFTDISYPMLLRAAGYRTGHIGKFGIGATPGNHVEGGQTTLNNMFDVFDNYEHWGPEKYFKTLSDGRVKHLTEITWDKALEFLCDGKLCSPNQPFCLTVSFNAAHAQDNDPQQYFWPAPVDPLYQGVTIPHPINSDPAFFNAQPDFLKISLNRARWHWRYDTLEKYQTMVKGYYRMISGVDLAIGRIMRELQRLGMDENTIIIFMSDNGMFVGERGFADCWLMYDASIRVPLIIYDPRANKKLRGDTIDEVALNVDVSPTIIDLAGVELPEKTQGRSLVPLLSGKMPRWRTDFFYEHLFEHPKIPKSEGVRTQRFKYIRYFEQKPIYEELYDLKKDAYEKHNLVDNLAYAKKLQELRKRCDELRDLYGGIYRSRR